MTVYGDMLLSLSDVWLLTLLQWENQTQVNLFIKINGISEM